MRGVRWPAFDCDAGLSCGVSVCAYSGQQLCDHQANGEQLNPACLKRMQFLCEYIYALMVTAIEYHTDAHSHAALKAAVGVRAEISWAGVRPGAVRYTPVPQLSCWEVK